MLLVATSWLGKESSCLAKKGRLLYLFVLKLQEAHLCMRLSASPSHMVAREVVEVAAGDDLALVESAAGLLRHLLCCFPTSWHLGGPP